MIKRPLVLILCAYLSGMYLAWQGLPVMVTIMMILLYCPFLYLFMYRINNKFISRRDKFLWCLPVLLFLGFCSLKDQLAAPKLYEAFDQETDGELTGSISMIVKKQWGKALYVKNNTITLPGGDCYICENSIIYCYDSQNSKEIQGKSLTQNFLVGNQITVRGTLKKFSEARNPGQFNEKLYYQIENIDFKMTAEHITITDAGYSKFHACLEGLKSKLLTTYESILPDKESGTVIAMLLGEKYLLDEEIKQLYQINGISHVLAISGLHISLIGMFIFYLLKKLKIPVVLATFASIFFIYSYGVLTNFGVSTNRAVVMMVVMLLSGLIGKTYDMLSSLSLSALIILLQNPLQLLSAGFLLSFGAVLGIAVIYPCLNKLYSTENKLINTLYSSLFVSISAQIATTPFILYFFYQFPTYSILINLMILPFVTVLTLSSILAGVAGAVIWPLGIFLIGGTNYILKFYEWVCRIGSRLPANLITVGKPVLWKIIVYTLLILLFVGIARKYEKKLSVLLLAAASLILLLPERNTGLEITILDVGQGDAIYMESKNGTTYLIDGGSTDIKQLGANRIQPFLLSQGTDRIDYAIITHSDNDHICGLMELIEKGNIRIRNLVLPGIRDKDEAYLKLESLAKDKNITIRYINTGDYIKDGAVKILCLHPSITYEPSSTNSYSTVLSVSYGDFDMLLTGDLQQDGEKSVEELLLNKDIWDKYFGDKDSDITPVTDYDVLKVAHHGSKSSTYMDFLQLIRPEISLISCGKDNYYGHPNKELLLRLEAVKSNIRITYDTGAITIKTDGKRMRVSEIFGD